MIPAFRNREIILASASPRRLQLLRQIGIENPRVCPAEAEEENSLDVLSPGALVRLNARRKAQATHKQLGESPAIIIAADTVVVLQGRLFGKPRHKREAADMLRQLSGRQHSVHTGLSLIDALSGLCVSGSSRTLVRFTKLSAADIARYVASGEPLDKAGAYGIQGAGALFVSSISGDYSTVVGLPLPLLARLARCFIASHPTQSVTSVIIPHG